jgi:uncharacterized protein (TIGR00255 family)
MIQSMTGFGQAQHSSQNYRVSVELKSLNGKFLELNVRFPSSLGEKELALRNMMNQQLKRGKVLGMISVEVLNPDLARLNVNEGIVAGYAKDLHNIASKIGMKSEVPLEYLLSLPHAINANDSVDDPERLALIEGAVNEAVKKLVESRNREGSALQQDLMERRKCIIEYLGEVQDLAGGRIENVRNRLSVSLAEIRDRITKDENRFEQEILYFLEKLDINEEIVRLRKHIDYYEATINEPESNGRRLVFISQEMGREINTIGSKANDAAMQVCVVKMKEELEKIKEQLNNIL